MACPCFVSEPLTEEEYEKTPRGQMYGKYAGHPNTFQVSMCDSLTQAQPCCCVSTVCLPFALCYMRHKVLNHVNPGSGMNDYICAQGYYPPCCCFVPGQMGEKVCARYPCAAKSLPPRAPTHTSASTHTNN